MPQCTFAMSVDGDSTSTAPTTTSSACVARSASDRKMLSLADSWMPRTFRTASRRTRQAAKISWPRPLCSAPRPGNTERYGGTVYDEIATVTV